MTDRVDREVAVLTRAEVARLLRMSTRTVDRAVKAGVLRAIRLTPNGVPRFARSEVEALIDGRRPQKSHLAAWHRSR